MTTVTLEPNRLSVVGHAGYGKVGYDIVCAGISTLTFTLKESLELYTSDCVEFFIADGKVIASWSELSEEGTFVGTFCVIKYRCKQRYNNHFICSSS